MAHIEGRLVGTGADDTVNLQCAHSLLGREHQEQYPEPSAERVLGILEYRSRDEREAIGVSAGAFGIPALPLPRQGNLVDRLALVASRALHAIRPAMREQILAAGFFGREHPLKLRPSQLRRELWVMLVSVLFHGETNMAQINLPVNIGIIARGKGLGVRFSDAPAAPA